MSFPPLTIDLGFTQAVQGWQPEWLTTLMRLTSDIVSPTVLFVLGLLTVIYLHVRKHAERTILAVFLLTMGNGLTVILKALFTRARPSPDQAHILIHETGYGFPSGHAIAVTLLVGIIVLLSARLAQHHRRLWLSLACVVALLVGYSRVYLGVHWLTDVLFGYLVGFAWVVVVHRWHFVQRLERESGLKD